MKINYTCKIIMATIVLMIASSSLFSQKVNLNVFWQENSDAETIQFSKDSKTLFTGGSTLNCYPTTCGQIKQWNVADSSPKSTITNFFIGLTNSLALSANEKKIYSAHGTSYCPGESGCYIDRPGLYNYNVNGSLNKTINPKGNGYAVAISPDEKTIAVGTGYNNTGEIGLYDTNFNLLRTLPGHLYNTTDVSFTKDGKNLISAGQDGLIKFWDYKTGALVRTLIHGDYLNGGGNDVKISISTDGLLLASTGDGYNLNAKVWRIADGKLLSTFPLNITVANAYATVEFTPDGKYLSAATTQFAKNGFIGKILFWNLQTNVLVTTYTDNMSKGIKSIAFSSDSKLIAYGGINNSFKVARVSYSNNVPLQAVAPQNINAEKVISNNANAYPNPFNKGTTIQYTLQKSERVSIKLFNTVGGEIATILSETQQTEGVHQIFLNTKNIPAGIYYCTIHLSNFNIIKKLVKF